MKTLAEKIAVMQAYLDGTPVEYRPTDGSSSWYSVPLALTWDWSSWDYRIAETRRPPQCVLDSNNIEIIGPATTVNQCTSSGQPCIWHYGGVTNLNGDWRITFSPEGGGYKAAREVQNNLAYPIRRKVPTIKPYTFETVPFTHLKAKEKQTGCLVLLEFRPDAVFVYRESKRRRIHRIESRYEEVLKDFVALDGKPIGTVG